MKTPQQIFEQVTKDLYIDEDGRDLALVVAAIEADREQRDRLADGTGRFTVEFDKPAWSSATVEDQEEWVNRAVVALNGEVYVTKVEVG